MKSIDELKRSRNYLFQARFPLEADGDHLNGCINAHNYSVIEFGLCTDTVLHRSKYSSQASTAPKQFGGLVEHIVC